MNTASTSIPRSAIPEPYRPPSHAGPIDLHLDANEGRPAFSDWAAFGDGRHAEMIGHYPDAAGLRNAIEAKWQLEAGSVLVTAGADDAIDRACRAFLGPGREIIAPTPTFEMIPRYARLAGARVIEPPWPRGPFPTEAVLAAAGPETAMIAVVSPNNPTGAVATAEDLRRLSRGAPDALLLVDLAYAEFASEDLTRSALKLPNAVVLRTFSKAFGLAGLRVGFALGTADNIRRMAAVGAPYPVSSLGLEIARRALERSEHVLPRIVARVRSERQDLTRLLRDLGGVPRESEGNFVLCEFADPLWVWRGLAGLGIGVRRFEGRPDLANTLRITCPGDEAAFERLCAGLRATLKPEALLLDIDGVIADVSGSYREAIRAAAAAFGVRVEHSQIAEAKARGNANNDWVLTQRLVEAAGVRVSLAEITERFESLYQGVNGTPGLRATERLIPDRGVLERLARCLPLAAVTGRPRSDCEFVLERFGIAHLFSTLVCMEDAPCKPDPAPVRLALQRLGVSSAWMVGDTPDDIRAARNAGVVPLGIAAPADSMEAAKEILSRAGASTVLSALSELEVFLP